MLSLLALLCLAAEPPRPDLSELEAKLTPLVKAHKGRVAVAVKHLESGASLSIDGDSVYPTASLIKLAVLVEVYLQAGEGKLKLDDPVALREADKVPGSGILTTHFSEGAKLPLRDLVRLMIAYSDNTATNLVLDRVSIVHVNKRMRDWGLAETRLNAKVFRGGTTSVDPARTRKYGLGSTTALEMVKLLEEIQVSDRLRPALKQAVLGHLSRNQDALKFRKGVPPGIRLAHKDGAVSDARTDAGIFYTPGGTIVLCVLTTNNADRRWAEDNAGNVLCAQVAREVYEHFNPR